MDKTGDLAQEWKNDPAPCPPPPDQGQKQGHSSTAVLGVGQVFSG